MILSAVKEWVPFRADMGMLAQLKHTSVTSTAIKQFAGLPLGSLQPSFVWADAKCASGASGQST